MGTPHFVCACACAPERLPLLYMHLSQDRSLLLLYRSRNTSGLARNGPRRGRHYPWCRSRWKHALPLAHDTHVGGHEQRHSTYTAYTGISLHGLGHEPEALHSTAAGIHSWQQQRKHTHSRHATRRLHRGMLHRGFTALHVRLLCCCLCVYIHTYIHTYLVLYILRSTILLSCRSYDMNIISSGVFYLLMCEAVMCDCWATRTTTVASDDSGIYRNASKYKYKSNTGGGVGEDNLYIMRTGHHFHFVCAPTCHVALTAHSRGRARLWGGCRSSPLLLARLSCVLVPPACGSVGWVSTRFLLLQLLVLADLP